MHFQLLILEETVFSIIVIEVDLGVVLYVVLMLF